MTGNPAPLRPMEPFEDIEDFRVSVLPRPSVVEALTRPVTRRLLVTDVGWFHQAGHHVISRAQGAEESIVILCADGVGWVEVDGVRRGIGGSTVVLIPQHVPHAYGSSLRAPWTIWWCHLRGSDVPDLFASTGLTRERPLVSLWSPERCVALIDEILAGMSRDLSPMRLVSASGAAFKLLTQIASDALSADRDSPLQRAMDYLTERLDSNIRVSDLARLVGISESRLGTLFRESTGGGIVAYHTALRMARARQLLDTSQRPVGEIARAVGYDDALYFSRVFQRVHGSSPSAYRAHRKG